MSEKLVSYHLLPITYYFSLFTFSVG
jgi:hypothetical protein